MLHFLCAGCRIVNLRILRCDMNTAEDVQKLYVIISQNFRFATKQKKVQFSPMNLGTKFVGKAFRYFSRGGY